MMDDKRKRELILIYRDGLLQDTLPFWVKHSIDKENGGFIFALDRDGTVLDTDKPIWVQSRFVWLLSTLYSTVEKRQLWIDLARHGIDFITQHGFDDDGRMFFILTREGKPLRKRRYLFSEFFTVLAFTAYAVATGDELYKEKSYALFEMILKYLNTPGLLPPKYVPGTREMSGLAVPMMMICICQQLKSIIDPKYCEKHIDLAITDIERHVSDQYRCVLENIGPNGEFIDHFDGRIITPGHGIEAGWFILHEALNRKMDKHLVELGCKIVDYCWERGWDREYGGMIYFRDAKGLPVSEYWHDMKFWWPQNETIIATLLAYYLTGDEKYAHWHRQVHDWAYDHFPDRECGEWFGYLHRDGSLSNTIKGNMWKGPFHLPRMQWYCWKLLETVYDNH